MKFDEKTASAEQLWEYYFGKYRNTNPVARWFISKFFGEIEAIIHRLPADASLLEVGCGPGESTRRIQSMLQGRRLEASEYEQRLVDMNLRHEFPVPLRQESVYQLQREERSFDCVLLLEVLEHLDDPEQALRELFRVSRDAVIVSVPNEPVWRVVNFFAGNDLSDFGNTPGHINHWSSRKITQLVSRHGDIVSVAKPFPWTIIHARVRSPRL